MQRRPPFLKLLALSVVMLVGASPVAAAQPDGGSPQPYPASDPVMAGLVAARLVASGVAALGITTTGDAARTTSTRALPACAYRDIKTRFRNLSQWRTTLVDTRLRVGSSYRPTDLVSVGKANIAGSGQVRRIIIDDLKAMARAARKGGRSIAVRSSYRSYTYQKAVFRSWVHSSDYKRALKYSARPGHSEHQLGTTIDFRSATSQRAPWDYHDWATSRPGSWMQKNAWKYGFVMSYPKGKLSTTCYGYEPWHYRYVGRALARKIHDSRLTPREYLWRHYESAS